MHPSPLPPACTRSPAVRRRRGTATAAAGFTLIEMMTAVVVMAVLLAVAAPGLAGFVRSSRVNAAQSELVASMMLARSEAAKRGQDVQLIAAMGGVPTDFGAGWLVWWDANGDGVVDNSAGSVEIIRSYPAPGGGIVVKGTVAAAAAPKFASTGFLSPATAVTFKVCDPNQPVRGYSVLLQPVGLADIQAFADMNSRPACP